MTPDIIDICRFLHSRSEYYVDNKGSHSAVVNDGEPVTLRDSCRTLADDYEPVPPRYDRDVKKLCGHKHLTWLLEESSYGHVALWADRKLASEDSRMSTVGGQWVQAVLRGGSPRITP